MIKKIILYFFNAKFFFFLGVILKSVIDANNEHQNKNQLSIMNLPDNTLVSQYKDLIREQDIQIQRLNQTNDFLIKEKQEFEVASEFFFKKKQIYRIYFSKIVNIIVGTSTRTSIDRQSFTRSKLGSSSCTS